jgi:hypothetical protein
MANGGARRQCGKPCPEQLLEIHGNGERLARRWPHTLPGESPSDLELACRTGHIGSGGADEVPLAGVGPSQALTVVRSIAATGGMDRT